MYDLVMFILYGPRDAVSVLMAHGHRVSLRRSWCQLGPLDLDRLYVLDGQRVTLAELEDAAEIHEKLRGRYTTRRVHLRLRTCSGLRSSPLRVAVKVVNQSMSIRTGLSEAKPRTGRGSGGDPRLVGGQGGSAPLKCQGHDHRRIGQIWN